MKARIVAFLQHANYISYPKKSSGTYSKIRKYLNLKKYNCTKLENGLIKTINSMK